MPPQVRPAAILLAAGGQLCVLAGAELARRRGLGPEHTRRLAHAAGASSLAPLALVLSLPELALLAGIFTGVLGWALANRRLASVNGVRRPTVGALVLPAGLLLGAWLAWSHPPAIAYAAVVIGLGDPGASLAGQRLGGPGWRVPGGRGTLAGSAAFLAVALAAGAALTGLDPGRLRPVAAAALVLTAVEAAIGLGLDNLPLPPLAGLLAVTWLGL